MTIYFECHKIVQVAIRDELKRTGGNVQAAEALKELGLHLNSLLVHTVLPKTCCIVDLLWFLNHQSSQSSQHFSPSLTTLGFDD